MSFDSPSKLLDLEKSHFDQLATDRDRNSFNPDLRNMGDNDFFYLSPFRRQALAQRSLGRLVDFVAKCVHRHLKPHSRVLDICCGNGWFALELARMGLDVIAVDLSEGNIQLAKKALERADLSPGFGSVTYLAADAMTWQPPADDFDLVAFMGGLHHLPEAEPTVLTYQKHLKPGGYFFCAEPLHENYGDVEAAIALLVRACLSCSDAWYEPIPLPQSQGELLSLVGETKREYQTWSDQKESGNQSPANNSSTGPQLWEMVNRHFRLLESDHYLPLMHRLIGGVRLDSEEKNLAFARFWHLLEAFLFDQKVLKSGGFLFWGQTP